MEKINIFWFRRDLRLHDNTALHYALQENTPLLPIFIFDRTILDKLEDPHDARLNFIHKQIESLKKELEQKGSSLLAIQATPTQAFEQIKSQYTINAVFCNRDYEPYARHRDDEVDTLLKESGINFYSFKDQVIFEKDEILTDGGDFYKVFTPYKNKWLKSFEGLKLNILPNPSNHPNFVKLSPIPFPSLESLGFKAAKIPIPEPVVNAEIIRNYDKTRDFPAIQGTSKLGIHLRFGTLSIRELALQAFKLNATYLNELIWREFYQMILWHRPDVATNAFKPAYQKIPWRNNEDEFKKWCDGQTGYPMVDAGMRELNETGYMHNRVRMVVASFLTKHLLIDWRWGEAYFAQKLLDFELASNNGGWQWAAGTGTDAQPYFRVFNPESQTQKFDKELKYIKKWVPEYGTKNCPPPVVDHKFARQRAIETYKAALQFAE
jgi:deoxyribodipyrimidine photo-lyase